MKRKEAARKKSVTEVRERQSARQVQRVKRNSAPRLTFKGSQNQRANKVRSVCKVIYCHCERHCLDKHGIKWETSLPSYTEMHKGTDTMLI